jgi:hypothetical protein
VAELNTFLRLDPDGPRSAGARAARAEAQAKMQAAEEASLTVARQ